VLGGLGGIASLAGVSVGSSNIEENIAVIKSREFIWSFVKDEKMMPMLFEDDWDVEANTWLAADVDEQPSRWDAWRLLVKEGVLNVSSDTDTGLVIVSIDWKDPELAAAWVSSLVMRINSYLRQEAIAVSDKKLKYLKNELKVTKIAENRQALFSLISNEQKQAMLASTQKDFAFRVIDPAVAPDKKIKPKRLIIVVLSAFVVGFLTVIFVFIQEGLAKKQEEGFACKGAVDEA